MKITNSAIVIASNPQPQIKYPLTINYDVAELEKLKAITVVGNDNVLEDVMQAKQSFVTFSDKPVITNGKFLSFYFAAEKDAAPVDGKYEYVVAGWIESVDANATTFEPTEDLRFHVNHVKKNFTPIGGKVSYSTDGRILTPFIEDPNATFIGAGELSVDKDKLSTDCTGLAQRFSWDNNPDATVLGALLELSLPEGVRLETNEMLNTLLETTDLRSTGTITLGELAKAFEVSFEELHENILYGTADTSIYDNRCDGSPEAELAYKAATYYVSFLDKLELNTAHTSITNEGGFHYFLESIETFEDASERELTPIKLLLEKVSSSFYERYIEGQYDGLVMVSVDYGTILTQVDVLIGDNHVMHYYFENCMDAQVSPQIVTEAMGRSGLYDIFTRNA